MNQIERWIVDFFADRGAVNGEVGEDLLTVNYFDRELLDSLGIVQLIVGIESAFDVRIDTANMQDPRFCTIRGLAQIVNDLQEG